MQLTSQQPTSTPVPAQPAQPARHRAGQPSRAPKRFLLTSIIAIASLLGSLLASVAAIATLAQPASAQTMFTPTVTITVPSGPSFNNIEFTVDFKGAPDSHTNCTDTSGIAELTYTSTANGTTSTSGTLPNLVNLPSGGTAGTDECEYIIDIDLKTPGTGATADRLKIFRAGTRPSIISATSSPVTDTWSEFPTISFTPRTCSSPLWGYWGTMIFPFIDDGNGVNVHSKDAMVDGIVIVVRDGVIFPADDGAGITELDKQSKIFFSPNSGAAIGTSDPGPSLSFPIPNTGTQKSSEGNNCRLAGWIFDYEWPEEIIFDIDADEVRDDPDDVVLTRSPAFSDSASTSGTFGPSNTNTLMVYETTYVHVAQVAAPEDTGRTTFEPLMSFHDAPAGFVGETFTFTYTVAGSTDASIATPDGTNSKCSAEATETFTVQSDNSITTNGLQTLTDSPEGTTLRCSYNANRPNASDNRLLGLTSLPGQLTTGASPDPGGGGKNGEKYRYEASSTFDTDVNISVPNATYSGVEFTVEFSHVSGGRPNRCSADTTVMYEVNSSGDVVPAGGASEATLVNVPAVDGRTPPPACVYSVTITLTDPANSSRLVRDGNAPSNIQGSAATVVVTDTWVAPATNALSEFDSGVSIAEILNGHEGATFTFTYTVSPNTHASIRTATAANTDCSQPATQTFTVGADNSHSSNFASVTSSDAPTLIGSPQGSTEVCIYDIDSPLISSTRWHARNTPTDPQQLTEASHDVAYTYAVASALNPTVSISVPMGPGFAGIGFTVSFSHASGGGSDGANRCSLDTEVGYVSADDGTVGLATDQTAPRLIDVPVPVTGAGRNCAYSVAVTLTDPAADSSKVMRSGSAPGNVRTGSATVSDTWGAPEPAAMDEPAIDFVIPGGTSNNPHAGETFTFGFAGTGAERGSELSENPIGCSTGVTLVTYTIQSDGTVDGDGTQLVTSPAGTSDTCSYAIVKSYGADASSERSLALTGSAEPDWFPTYDAASKRHTYVASTNFTPTVDINVPDGTYENVRFMVTYSFNSVTTGNANFAPRVCSRTTSVIYKVNASGDAVLDTGETAAVLIDDPASPNTEECIYNVSIDLIDSRDKRMSRMGTATSTVQESDLDIVDSWEEDTGQPTVRQPGIAFDIPGGTTNNPYAGETFTVVFHSDDDQISDAAVGQGYTNPTSCSPNGTRVIYVIQPDGSALASEVQYPNPDTSDTANPTLTSSLTLVQYPPGVSDPPSSTEHCLYYIPAQPQATDGRSLGLSNNFGSYINTRSDADPADRTLTYLAGTFFEPVVDLSVPQTETTPGTKDFAGVKFVATFTRSSGLENRCSLPTKATYEVHSSGTVIWSPATGEARPRLVDSPGGNSSTCEYSVAIDLHNDDSTTQLERDSGVTLSDVQESSPTVTDRWVAPGGQMPAHDSGLPAPGSGTSFTPEITISVPASTTGPPAVSYADITFTVSFAQRAMPAPHSGCTRTFTDVTYTSAADGTTSITSGTLPTLVNLPTGGTEDMDECVYTVAITKTDPAGGTVGETVRAGANPEFVSGANPAVIDLWRSPPDLSFTLDACSSNWRPGFVVVLPFVADANGNNVFAASIATDYRPAFNVQLADPMGGGFAGSEQIPPIGRTEAARVVKKQPTRCAHLNSWNYQAEFPEVVRVKAGEHTGATLTRASDYVHKRISNTDPIHTVRYETTYRVPYAGPEGDGSTETYFEPVVYIKVPDTDDSDGNNIYSGETFTFHFMERHDLYNATNRNWSDTWDGPGGGNPRGTSLANAEVETTCSTVESTSSHWQDHVLLTQVWEVQDDGSVTLLRSESTVPSVSNNNYQLVRSPENEPVFIPEDLRFCGYGVVVAQASSSRTLARTSNLDGIVFGRTTEGQALPSQQGFTTTQFIDYRVSGRFTPDVNIDVPDASFAGVEFTVEFKFDRPSGDITAPWKCSGFPEQIEVRGHTAATVPTRNDPVSVTYVVDSNGNVVLAQGETAASLVDRPAGTVGGNPGFETYRCDYSVSVALADAGNSVCLQRDPSANAPGHVRSGDRATVSDTWVAVAGGTCVATGGTPGDGTGGTPGGGTTPAPTQPATNFDVTIDATVPTTDSNNDGTTDFAGTTLRFGFNASAAGLSNPQGCSSNVSVTLTVATDGSVPQGTASLIDTPLNSSRNCTYQVVFPQAPAGGRLGYVAAPSDVVRVSAAAKAASYTFSVATLFDPDITITVPQTFDMENGARVFRYADSEFEVAFNAVSGSHRGCSSGVSETHAANASGTVAVSTTGGRTEAMLVDVPAGGAASDSCSYVVAFPNVDSSGQLGLPSGAARATVSAASTSATQAYEPATTFEPSVSVTIPEVDTDRDGTHDFSGQDIAVSYVPVSGSDNRCAATGSDTFAATDDLAGVVERTTMAVHGALPVLIDQPAGSSVSCVYNVVAPASIESTIAGRPALRLASVSSRATITEGGSATLSYAFPPARTRVDPLPLIRAADTVGELPISVSLTVPSVAGRIFGSGDVFEVNVSVPGQCGIDTQLFGGVQASDGVAYGVPASQTGLSQLIGSGTRQVNNRAAYTLPAYVESGGQQIPCEVRVTQLTTPVGCVMRGASQGVDDQLYVSAVWSQGAVGYDISVSFDCDTQQTGVGDGAQQGWVSLERGWMILPFNGDDGTLPSAFVSNLDDAITSVWVWDAGQQNWRGWAADGSARSLARLNRGDVLMVYAPVAATVSFSPATLLDTADTSGSLTIPALYSIQVFGGAATVALTSLFGTQTGSVAVLFRWNATSQSWSYYLPGRAPIATVDIPWFNTIGPRDAVFVYNIAGGRVTIPWS